MREKNGVWEFLAFSEAVLRTRIRIISLDPDPYQMLDRAGSGPNQNHWKQKNVPTKNREFIFYRPKGFLN